MKPVRPIVDMLLELYPDATSVKCTEWRKLQKGGWKIFWMLEYKVEGWGWCSFKATKKKELKQILLDQLKNKKQLSKGETS